VPVLWLVVLVGCGNDVGRPTVDASPGFDVESVYRESYARCHGPEEDGTGNCHGAVIATYIASLPPGAGDEDDNIDEAVAQ
jgi:hypothetical protein